MRIWMSLSYISAVYDRTNKQKNPRPIAIKLQRNWANGFRTWRNETQFVISCRLCFLLRSVIYLWVYLFVLYWLSFSRGLPLVVELAALFHYRYTRIHPFEDGNGRIARLLVNFILSRHGYPMIVVRSRKKAEYLEALHKSDILVGPIPSDGANAQISEIRHFAGYFENLVYEEIMGDIAFVREHDDNLWWHDGLKVKFRSPSTSKMLMAMQANPLVTIRELSELTGVNKSAIQKQLDLLENKGYIVRNHSAREKWYVVMTSSN